MSISRVGLIGWRGMVGSVLLSRMREEGDFAGLDPTFFSTSNPGALGPEVGAGRRPLLDAHDLDALTEQEVLLTCQGGAYTHRVYSDLRARGWEGIWIDAASTLRMEPDATLILDPVNGGRLRDALHDGARTFVGPNCTVSLMLMGLQGLLRTDEVEWISSMTYQAASGAGAQSLRELVAQMRFLGAAAGKLLDDPGESALHVERCVAAGMKSPGFPTAEFGVPLAASVLPWIDCAAGEGQTREEWKAMAEANKLLGREDNPLPIDGICVRVGALRCHAQALTVKLRRDLPLDEIEERLGAAHSWSEVIPNEPEATLRRLTPAAVAGTLRVPIGRLRKMKMGPTYLSAFTVGDQLLWGAAEPLRRMLCLLRAA